MTAPNTPLFDRRIRDAISAAADRHDIPINLKHVDQLANAASRAVRPTRDRAIAHRTPNGTHVSEQQLRILRLAAGGMDNNEIAEALCLSRDSIRSHMSRLFQAMGARSRAHAVALGMARGWITAEHVNDPITARAMEGHAL
jgi:DNA-binding NarL/FixJ family response regulator